MKAILLILFSGLLIVCCGNRKASRPEIVEVQSTSSIYDFEKKAITGETISLADYKGKKILIVNTASKCGNTPQYADLQKLHETYGGELVILGFPANNFAGQEPGSNAEIATFCKENYGVTFQMFEKVSVLGDDQDPLYRWLTDKNLNGWNEEEPNWNFSKYLINENGELVNYFAASVNPMGEEILAVVNN